MAFYARKHHLLYARVSVFIQAYIHTTIPRSKFSLRALSLRSSERGLPERNHYRSSQAGSKSPALYRADPRLVFAHSCRRRSMAEAAKPGIMRHETDFSIQGSSPAVVVSRSEAAAAVAGNRDSESSSMVLVLLNYNLPRFTPRLWSQACKRFCADGGANRLHDELPQFLPGDDPDVVRPSYTPDAIIGDLDSVRADVKDYYCKLGATIVDESNDQDTTDLHKCLRYIRDCTPDLDKTKTKVVVVGALGGRFDLEAANINVLWMFANSMKIVLLSEESSLLLLPNGYKHEIYVDKSFEGPHCGLVPIGAPSLSTTTTGLHWNLDETPMSFGSLISTCNLIVGEVVTVVSDVHLLWTTELRYKP